MKESLQIGYHQEDLNEKIIISVPLTEDEQIYFAEKV
jgi:hypothetical protein